MMRLDRVTFSVFNSVTAIRSIRYCNKYRYFAAKLSIDGLKADTYIEVYRYRYLLLTTHSILHATIKSLNASLFTLKNRATVDYIGK